MTAPADRWSCWLAWLIEAGHALPDDGWTLQGHVIGQGRAGPITWGTEYVNGSTTLRCIESGVFGRHPSEIACYVGGVEQWRQRIPHEVGYGPARVIPIALDRISVTGIPLARY